MILTEEQNLAVNSKEKNILVSASAGSGKTAVLVERILKLVTDKKNPVDIDKILAVTFTDAAATQVKQKIYSGLEKIFTENPTENIRHQILLLSNANISTIHSFCAKIIRKYFYLTDLNKDFRIAQEPEISLLESDILDKILEKEYQNGEKLFLETAEIYNDGKFNNNGLKDLLRYIYKFSRSLINPNEWLNECAKKFDLSRDKKIEETVWYKNLISYIKNYLNQAKTLTLNSIKICDSDVQLEKYIPVLNDDLNFIFNLSDVFEKSFDSAREIIKSKKYMTLPRVSKNIAQEKKEQLKENRDRVKKITETLKDKIFFSESDNLLKNIKESHDTVKEIIYLVNRFSGSLAQKKAEKNILGFDDLEQLAFEILKNKKIGLKEKFHEVLIDEYQDINDIQEGILNLVADKKFMVGDVKQSIYNFRNSSPDIFIKKYRDYNINKINLTNNFRSSYKIIDVINFFFSGIINKNFGQTDYQNLITVNKNKCEDAEIYVLNIKDKQDKKNKVQMETEFICDKIKMLIKNGICKNFSEIVILTRSKKNIDIIKKIFSQKNIPVSFDDEDNFFELEEISLLINFLRIIDNPRNEIALISVLRSDIYCVDDNELFHIRNINPKVNFYECIKEYSGLERFKSDLNNFRDKKNFISVSDLINEVISATDFFNIVLINPDGEIRQQNIIKFLEFVSHQQETNYTCLFDLIRYLEKIKDAKINIDITKKNSDAVKIMTIHKSKGLEFPVVFVSFTGQEFNMQDLYKNKVLLSKNLGFGLKYVDIKRRMRFNTLARTAVEFEIHRRNLEEEARILYVAMTRAQKKLIITGTKKIDSLSKISEISNKIFFNENAKCYLDWLVPIALKKDFPGKLKIIESKELKETEESYDKKNNCEAINHNQIKNFSPAVPPIIPVNNKIKTEMEWHYPYDISVRSKISVTELINNKKPKFKLTAPSFLKKNIISPTQKGTAIHTVLQHLDLNLKSDEHEINKFLCSLIQKKLLTHQERKIIPIEKFISFLESELVYKMRHAEFIRRECPFLYGIKNNSDQYETLVHGVIDCFFEFEKKLYLIDYKTDTIPKNKARRYAEKFRPQIKIYKDTIEKNFLRTVDFCAIYFFENDTEVTL